MLINGGCFVSVQTVTIKLVFWKCVRRSFSLNAVLFFLSLNLQGFNIAFPQESFHITNLKHGLSFTSSHLTELL